MSEFYGLVDEFVKVTKQSHDTYAYSSGYLQSLVGEMMQDLPKKKQKIYWDQMARAVVAEKQRLSDKILDKKTA